MESECIKNIRLNDGSSWKDKAFITFDIDWACDEVLEDTIDLVEGYDIKATWFITHNTPVLDRLATNPNFELGIHPNFNHLLVGDGDPRNRRDAKEIIENLLQVVPNAKSVRSHSLTQSSRILEIFKEYGLFYDCNDYIPYINEIVLSPWLSWNLLVKCPYFWTDDFATIYDKKYFSSVLINKKGLKIFGFHPIHVFLNTVDFKHYSEKIKPFYKDVKKLKSSKYQGYGVRNYLEDTLRKLK